MLREFFRGPGMHLHSLVLESAQELILRLFFIQHLTGSVRDRLCQIPEARKARRFSDGHTCPCEDDQPVVAQGI